MFPHHRVPDRLSRMLTEQELIDSLPVHEFGSEDFRQSVLGQPLLWVLGSELLLCRRFLKRHASTCC